MDHIILVRYSHSSVYVPGTKGESYTV